MKIKLFEQFVSDDDDPWGEDNSLNSNDIEQQPVDDDFDPEMSRDDLINSLIVFGFDFNYLDDLTNEELEDLYWIEKIKRRKVKK